MSGSPVVADDRPGARRGDAPAMSAPSPVPVIYVAGSGHTGSTLLALVMNSHPEIACIGETAVKPKIVRSRGGAGEACSCGSAIGECAFWRRVTDLVRQEGLDFGPDQWSNDYRLHNTYALKVLNRLCATSGGRGVVQWAADHLPVYSTMVQRKDAVNVALLRAVLTAADARIFADTSKGLTRLTHLLRLREVDVKIVILTRDVRGYAASVKRRGGSIADAARTWLKDQRALAAVTAGLPPSRVHRLHYEALCGQPAESQAALWRFCGVQPIAPIERLLATDHHVLGNSMRLGGEIRLRLDESWRKRLERAEMDEILAIAGAMNRTVGYADA